MSDAVTSAEIEDLLTSIRRLVSEHPGTPAEGPAPGEGVLVLTPALRVVDPGAPFEPAGPQPVADEESAAPAQEPRAEDRPSPEPQAQAHSQRQAEESDERPAAPTTGAEGAGSLAERVAQLEAAVAASQGAWEPDGSEAQGFFAHGRASEIEEAEVIEVTEFARERATDDAPEAAEPREEPQAPQARAEVLDAEADDEEFAYLDEAALRDLVLKLIREELRGQMGERITYNVRRMVRREIQRALTVREVE